MASQAHRLSNIELKITSAEQIPGLTDSNQHIHYYEIAQQLSVNSNVVEVGCGYGRSTWAWLNAIPEQSNLYVVDNFSMAKASKMIFNKKTKNRFIDRNINQRFNPDIDYLKKYFDRPQKDVFDQIIKQHPKFNLLKDVYPQDFEDWKVTNKIKFDLAYLDAHHGTEQVASQLEYFKDCKFICGDDYKWISVKVAVDEFTKQNNYMLTTFNNFYVIKT